MPLWVCGRYCLRTGACSAYQSGQVWCISVWTSVLLDKFLYGRPSQRLLQDLADHGLNMSAGTLAGGLQAIAPLFKPLNEALQTKLRSEPYWHADETRWAVFVDVQGKVGHRWYLWVFHSSCVVHYVIDQTRAAEVIIAELAGVDQGIISCDRYSGYKRFARLNPGVVLAFCWAHVRRDFLELANSYPQSSKWAPGTAVGGQDCSAVSPQRTSHEDLRGQSPANGRSI